MATSVQPVQHVPFLPGIRQDADSVLAPLGTLVDATNVRFGRSGAVYPRRGTKAISRNAQNSILSSSMVPAGTGTMMRGNSPYLLAGGLAFLQDDTTERFTSLGAYSTVVPYRELGAAVDTGTPGSTLGRRKFGVAVNSLGYVCRATAADGFCFSVFSPDGALVYESRTATSTVLAASVVAVGADFICVYQDGVTLIGFRIANAGSSSLSITTNLTATVGTLVNSNADTGWDITPAANGTQWYLAFQSAAGTLRVDLFTGTTSAANVTQAVTAADTPCSIWADANRVWLGWYEDPAATGAVRHRTFNVTTLVAIDATQTLETVVNTAGPPLIGPAQAGNDYSATAFAVWRTSQGSTSNYLTGTRFRYLIGNALVGSTRTLWHHHPISKPDSASRAWCVTGNQAPNCFLQRAVMVSFYKEPSDGFGANEPQIACARPPTEVSNGTGTGSALPSAVNQKTMFAAIAEFNGRNYFAVPEVLRKGSGTTNTSLIQMMLVEVRTDTAEPIRWANGIGETLCVGGQIREFPGRIAPSFGTQVIKGGFETGFEYAPIVLTATESAGGSLTVGGTYSWLFVFEWVDQYGRLHQSAPSAPHTQTLTAANNLMTFTVTSLDCSDRGSSGDVTDARLVAYRTKAGIPNVYYRDSLPLSAPSARSATGAVTVVSSNSDATIGAQQTVYTSAGVKDNALAPAARFGCMTEDRLVLGGGFNPYILTVSKQIFPGFPIEFTESDAFRIALLEPCTGLAYQDGNIIAFCERSIYVTTGDGPDDQGIGQFSKPRALCRDLGTSDWRSIVETPRGIMFRSARGFYLLPRGGGVPVYIGSAVQRLFSPTAYPQTLGAVSFSCSEHRTVRWLLSDGSTGTVEAVYDLDASESDPNAGWSKDTFANQLAAIGVWPTCLDSLRSSFASATHIGYLEQLTPAYLGDASNTEAITYAVETTDIRSAGPAGWFSLNSVAALMSQPDGGTLTMTITTDGTATPFTFALLPTATGSLYRQQAPSNQKCSAASVRLSVVRATNKRGPTLHALTLEQSPVPGARRTDSTERT